MISQQLRYRISNIQRLEGWCTHQKAEHIAELILDRRPELIVEIGVFGGRTSIAMGMACQYLRHGKVIGIDPWTHAAALEGEQSAVDAEWWSKLDMDQIYSGAMNAIRALGVEDYVEFRRQHDADALGSFPDGGIDMLHLDSNHSELISVRSVRDWAPKVKPGGVFLMDDTLWPTQQRAVELLTNGDLGTKYLSTHDMHTPDANGTMVCSGQYMVFEKISA